MSIPKIKHALIVALAANCSLILHAAREAEEISLLVFGNSYSYYGGYLPAIAESMGDKLDMVCLRNTNSIHETLAFLDQVQQGKAVMPTEEEAAQMKLPEQKRHGYCGYQYGAPSPKALVNIQEMLESRHWDYVALQAHSSYANDYQECALRIEPMLEFLSKYYPDTEFIYYLTTQYRNDELLFKVTPNRSVYKKVRGEHPYTEDLHFFDAYQVVQELADNYDFQVVPGGVALQNARYSPLWGESYPAPDFDYFHAAKPEEPAAEAKSLHLGFNWRGQRDRPFAFIIDSHPSDYLNYLTACVWYEMLFGKSCVGSDYVPGKLTPEECRNLQIIAHETAQGQLPPLRLELPDERLAYGDMLWQRAVETTDPSVRDACLISLYAYLPEHPKMTQVENALRNVGKLPNAQAAAQSEAQERSERERKYQLIWDAVGETTLENDKALGRWTDL